jgi:hypothetical protein
VRLLRFALLAFVAALLLAVKVAAPATGAPAHGGISCRSLTAPSSLGATLLGLHRDYERHRPDVHNPTITGPVGHVYLGICAGERFALASFDARYNGVYFGVTDQPERFIRAPGGPWRDLGNTGGNPCGGSPTALLEAWKIAKRCPE